MEDLMTAHQRRVKNHRSFWLPLPPRPASYEGSHVQRKKARRKSNRIAHPESYRFFATGQNKLTRRMRVMNSLSTRMNMAIYDAKSNIDRVSNNIWQTIFALFNRLFSYFRFPLVRATATA